MSEILSGHRTCDRRDHHGEDRPAIADLSSVCCLRMDAPSRIKALRLNERGTCGVDPDVGELAITWAEWLTALGRLLCMQCTEYGVRKK